MPGTPERRDDDVKDVAKAFAARSIFAAAGFAIVDDEPLCWKVRGGDAPSAPWFLFWPANGFWRAEADDGKPRGYGASALVATIKAKAI
jgi:hypothetical protein